VNLPRFSLKHPAIVVAATAIVVLWGLVAFFTAPRREDPEFQIRSCVILTSWPGATAEKIEQLITDPIEKSVDALDEVEKVTSVSRVGLSAVFVFLEQNIKTVDETWDKVRARVARVRGRLPQGCSEPLVDTEYGDTAAMVLAVHQKPLEPGRQIERHYTPREMEVIAKRLRDELKLLEPVAKVDLYGVQQEAIYLETDMGRWSQLQLTTNELRTLLEQRNIVAPGGTIETELGRFGIRPTGELAAVRNLERVIVGAHEYRSPTYLKDLDIQVSRRYQEPSTLLTRFGTPDVDASCIVVSFTMKKGENIVELGRLVRSRLEELKQTLLPRDIEVTVVGDQPAAVALCVNDFVDNLWQAIVIVILVAFLLIGLRIALVMAATIPIVMVATIGVVRFFDVQLEQISIASLIIALGMLVDNAIEVGDNVHRLLEEGLGRFEAAVEGARQIAFPVLIATLTTVAAFLPMVMIPGEEGEYCFSLPVVVSTALILSWIVAMSTTTLMAYWMLRPSGKHGQAASPLSSLVAALKRLLGRRSAAESRGLGDRYAGVCAACLRHKGLTIGVTVALFIGSCTLLGTGLVGVQFFPMAYRDQFTVDVFLPEGVPIGHTNEVCMQVEKLLRELSPQGQDGERTERLTSMVSYVGQGGPRFYLNLNPEQQASNYAQIVVNTSNPDVVEGYVRDLRREARSRIPGARIVPRALDMGPGLESPIGVRLIGDDSRTLRRYAERLKDSLRGTTGTIDVHDTWGSLGYQMAVDVDEDKANLAGVTNAAIAQTMHAYFSGHHLTTYREGDHQVPVYLRLPRGQRTSLDAMRAVYVEGAFGKVPLDAVATVRTEWQPAKILRWKLHRMIEVRARVRDGLLASAVLKRAMPQIRQIEADLPPGYRIEIGGEHESVVKSQENQSKAFGVSLLFIIMCLVVQYNSLVKPLIILSTLPMAVTGAFLGLFITGQPLGFMAILGLMSLAGVVLNDAIVLIEFIGTAVKEKLSNKEDLAAEGERSYSGLTRDAFRACVVRAGRMRLLPISLTTLTTVGGLIPLALFGGPLWTGMAVVIIFGLLLATLLTLLVIPTVLTVFVEYFRVNLVQPIE